MRRGSRVPSAARRRLALPVVVGLLLTGCGESGNDDRPDAGAGDGSGPAAGICESVGTAHQAIDFEIYDQDLGGFNEVAPDVVERLRAAGDHLVGAPLPDDLTAEERTAFPALATILQTLPDELSYDELSEVRYEGAGGAATLWVEANCEMPTPPVEPTDPIVRSDSAPPPLPSLPVEPVSDDARALCASFATSADVLGQVLNDGDETGRLPNEQVHDLRRAGRELAGVELPVDLSDDARTGLEVMTRVFLEVAYDTLEQDLSTYSLDWTDVEERQVAALGDYLADTCDT